MIDGFVGNNAVDYKTVSKPPPMAEGSEDPRILGIKHCIYILDAFSIDVIDVPHKGGIKLATDALVRELEEIRDV